MAALLFIEILNSAMSMRHSKIIFVVSIVTVLVIFFTRCVNNYVPVSNDTRGDKYAGAQACITCHKDISNSFAHTNHFKTSSAINDNEIGKLVTPANNNFYFM